MTGNDADAQAFEAIMAGIEAPSYVVTTAAGGERAGCLVGFATRCSIDPPRFGVWLSKLNRTYRVARRRRRRSWFTCCATATTISPRRFGGDTGDEVDKFAAIEWRPGPDGCPVIERLDWFAGSIVERVDTGDHVAFVLAPRGGRCRHVRAPAVRAPRSATSTPGIPIPGR